MKRSEALTKLSNKLQKSQNLFDGYKNGNLSLKSLCDNLADRSLWFTENTIGMLPPPDHVELISLDNEKGAILYIDYPNIKGAWEPEDDA